MRNAGSSPVSDFIKNEVTNLKARLVLIKKVRN
jgi:hypothetical protein